MKAIQVNGYGGPEVMTLNEEVVAPVAAAGEVLVAVHATSVNPFDISVREGKVRSMAELTFPAILGGDVSGLVAAIGEDVTGFTIGEEVYGVAGALSSQGSFAEFTLVKATQLAPKPTSVNFETAAAIPMVATSAYQGLVEHISLQPGQKILIHGGAGGIGSVAIQIAHHLGAYIVTTTSADTADFAKELGADETIDYRNDDFTTIVEGCDAVFDTVGGDIYAKSFEVVKPGGIVLTMAAQANEGLAKAHDARTVSQFTRATSERLQKVAELVDAGVFKINVDTVFPLEKTADAMEFLKSGHPKGKVVIQVVS